MSTPPSSPERSTTPREPSDTSGPAKPRERDPRTTARPDEDTPLGPAWSALDRGDHAQAHTLATALLAHEDPSVRDGARDLLDRLRPDRAVLGVLTATLLLTVALALAYLGAGPHAHGAHPPSGSPVRVELGSVLAPVA